MKQSLVCNANTSSRREYYKWNNAMKDVFVNYLAEKENLLENVINSIVDISYENAQEKINTCIRNISNIIKEAAMPM